MATSKARLVPKDCFLQSAAAHLHAFCLFNCFLTGNNHYRLRNKSGTQISKISNRMLGLGRVDPAFPSTLKSIEIF